MFLFGLRLRSRSSLNMPKLTGKDMRPCSARTARAAHLGIMWGTGRIGNAFCATSNPFLRYLFSIDQLFLVILSGWLAQPTKSFCTGYILSRELCKDQLYLIAATHELLRIVPEIPASTLWDSNMAVEHPTFNRKPSLGTRGVSTWWRNRVWMGASSPFLGFMVYM